MRSVFGELENSGGQDIHAWNRLLSLGKISVKAEVTTDGTQQDDDALTSKIDQLSGLMALAGFASAVNVCISQRNKVSERFNERPHLPSTLSGASSDELVKVRTFGYRVGLAEFTWSPD